MLPEVSIPSLETERLLLRGWREEDVAAMTDIVRDPEVGRWLGYPDPDRARESIHRWLEHWHSHAFGLWAVEEKSSARFIGRVGLVEHADWEASEHDAEVGWTLARESWGNGYATEAARAALDFGRSIGLRRIISITLPANQRSRRVMQKLGLTYRGEANWHGFDQVWYATELTKGDPTP